MKKAIYILTLFFAYTLLNQSALAKGWDQGPCAEDVKKFCADIKPGEGRIIQCLKAHENELSTTCKEKRDAKKAERKEKRAEKRKELIKEKIEARKAKHAEKLDAIPSSTPSATTTQ